MYHDLPRSASFWSFLLAVDEDLATETRKKGCRVHLDTVPEPEWLCRIVAALAGLPRKGATP